MAILCDASSTNLSLNTHPEYTMQTLTQRRACLRARRERLNYDERERRERERERRGGGGGGGERELLTTKEGFISDHSATQAMPPIHTDTHNICFRPNKKHSCV